MDQQSAVGLGTGASGEDAPRAEEAIRRGDPDRAGEARWASESQSQILKLSICVITYNRSRYLRKTLTNLFATANFAFNYEVLVCDNCSTDDTPDVVAELAQAHPQIRYVRQKRNVGSEGNLLTAYHLAEGEYVVYLADDDQLLPSAVAQVLDYMDRNPDVGVSHCPWEIWDDVAKETKTLFYKVDAPRQFGREDSLALCDFILQNHIFPEIAIYRTEVMRRMMYMPQASFWAFVHLINVLDHAKVAFLPLPFYRSITLHWPGEQRRNGGIEQAMTCWDLYRGGLDAMIHRAFQLRGLPGIPDDLHETVTKAVQAFVNARMKVALGLLISNKRYIEAHAVLVRLLVARGLSDTEAQQMKSHLVGRAGLQAFLQAFDSITTLDCVALYEVTNPAAFRAMLQELRSDLRIVDLDESTLDHAGDDRMLVLTHSHECRETLLDVGFHPGLVMVERDLAWMFAS